jgi:hypothetical protein
VPWRFDVSVHERRGQVLTAHCPVAQIVWARFTEHLIVMLAVFLPRYGRRLFATRRPAIQLGCSA